MSSPPPSPPAARPPPKKVFRHEMKAAGQPSAGSPFVKGFTRVTGRAAFVTGATGFVGLNLVDALLHAGWAVYALHRPGSRRARLLRELPSAAGAAGARLHLVEGDLATDGAADLQRLLPPAAAPLLEVVYHLVHLDEAGAEHAHPARLLTQPGFTPEGGAEHRRLNLRAMRVAVAAAASWGAQRLVYCSSWSAYGRQPPGTEVHERTPARADEPLRGGVGCCGRGEPVPYFQSKAECEALLRASLGQPLREAGGAALRGGVIVQPCTILGRFGEAGWCRLFGLLREAGGSGAIPGLPGRSSFVDVQDLADAMVAAARAGEGRGEAYVVGGTNAPALEMQREMAALVGVPPPRKATPAAVLLALARWNESLLHVPWLRCLRIKPRQIGPPWLVWGKLTQDQSARSKAAQAVLGYRLRPLHETLRRNYEWLERREQAQQRAPPAASGGERATLLRTQQS